MNQIEAHWILQALRNIVSIGGASGLIEGRGHLCQPQNYCLYLGTADGSVQECHIAYHSSLMAAGWGGIGGAKCRRTSGGLA